MSLRAVESLADACASGRGVKRRPMSQCQALGEFVRHMLATHPKDCSDDALVRHWLAFADGLVASGAVHQNDRDRWGNPFYRARYRRTTSGRVP